MNNDCGREWTRKHLVNAFTSVFVNKTLKNHREKVLFDRQVAQLPATQPLVENAIQIERLEEEIRDINSQLKQLLERRNTVKWEIYHLKHGTTNVTTTPSARTFVRACPDENCRGFLSQQWKCGICEKYTCKECHIIKNGGRNDEEHVCHPDDVATAKLIASDTKPCPKCGTGIFKIDGCDQMWCTSCHTAFSWRTGIVENRIHNPHYYEWMRRNNQTIPRAEGDNPMQVAVNAPNNCIMRDNFLFTQNLMTYMRRRNVYANKQNDILERWRCIIHIQDVVLPIYRRDNEEAENTKLRILYMRNMITEKSFKQRIQVRTKKYEKNREIFDVLDMFVNTCADIFVRFLDSLKNGLEFKKCEDIYLEIFEINEYANECLKIISDVYKTKELKINLYTHNGLE
jgi:ribosomal protein S27AE